MIGSVYEFRCIKTQQFPLSISGSEWADDTARTVALAQTIVTGQPHAKTIRAFGLQHHGLGMATGLPAGS
jgi:ADP-ribosylglycohydrolase